MNLIPVRNDAVHCHTDLGSLSQIGVMDNAVFFIAFYVSGRDGA